MKLKKRLIFALFVILLVLIAGCNIGKKDVKKSLEEIRTGTEGIVMNFLPNNPPDVIHAEQGDNEGSNSFDVVLEARNKGAYPQPEDSYTAPPGRIFLSGYDTNILKFDKDPPIEELNGKALDGKSTINPNGGLDVISFKGKVLVGNLNVDKYEPTLLATACYDYSTVAGPSACIDPNPYSTLKEKKVCEIQDITLSNQGSPIAVTKIDEEAFATKTQFKITIKNVGKGDVIRYGALDKCTLVGDKLAREDVDKVYLAGAKIGTKSLTCGPFATNQGGIVRGISGDIRLLNGEGFVICELQSSDYASTKTAYSTPMRIELLYGYRNTVEKKIQIKKETSGLGGSNPAPTSTGVTSTPASSHYEGNPLPSGQTDICLERDPVTKICTRTTD